MPFAGPGGPGQALQTGSVAMASAPSGFGGAELFMNSAACVFGNRRRAVELRTDSAPPEELIRPLPCVVKSQ
jgi:hypothetical protein